MDIYSLDKVYSLQSARAPSVIILQLVHIVVEPLFTLAGRSNLDALLHEPLHHEERLIITPAQTIEHENQQGIIAAIKDVPLQAVCEQRSRVPPWLPETVLRADKYDTEWYRKD